MRRGHPRAGGALWGARCAREPITGYTSHLGLQFYGRAALHAPAPFRVSFARHAERRFIRHAYWYAVLLGMPDCMLLRPVWGRLCAARGAPLYKARVWHAVLMGMLHCMPLRPV